MQRRPAGREGLADREGLPAARTPASKAPPKLALPRRSRWPRRPRLLALAAKAAPTAKGQGGASGEDRPLKAQPVEVVTAIVLPLNEADPTKALPPADEAAPAAKEAKMVNAESAQRGAKKGVVRPVCGARPEKVSELEGGAPAPDRRQARPSAPAPVDVRAKKPSPKIEVNPKLERSKHLVTTPAPAAPEPTKKPMSVAEKNRAQAEAVFARLSAPEVTEQKPEAVAPVELPFSARHKDDAQSNYLTRVSERDTITTRLRLASGRAEALAAATELADRFSLPPDQGLLVKVMELGDQRLTKLALEELLELDDRGRVRGNPELRQALGRVKQKDPEIQELKQLFLEKLGGPA
jgi:hypothetical protein